MQTMRVFGVMIRPAAGRQGWALVNDWRSVWSRGKGRDGPVEAGPLVVDRRDERLDGPDVDLRFAPRLGAVLGIWSSLGDAIIAALLITAPGREVIRVLSPVDLELIGEAAAVVPTSPPWPGGGPSVR